jgi:ClpP class serine protease
MSSVSSMQSLVRFVWPWAKAVEPRGPIVAVIEMSGVLQRPSQARGRIPTGNIHFEKAKKDVDSAFGLAKVQAVALDINCPGESHTSNSFGAFSCQLRDA